MFLAIVRKLLTEARGADAVNGLLVRHDLAADVRELAGRASDAACEKADRCRRVLAVRYGVVVCCRLSEIERFAAGY